MVDPRTRLGRALRESEKTTATDNSTATEAFAKTNKGPRIEEAKQAADEAKERAEESIQAAADKLGYIDFEQLLRDGKLSGELPGVYIRNVAAESILAGDIDAEYLNVRGRLNVGPVTLNPDGITMPTVGEGENPDVGVQRKIKPLGGWAAFEFPVGVVSRGIGLSATGQEDGLEGVVRLQAKTRPNANPAGPSSAQVVVRSTLGGKGLMWAQNGTDLRVDGSTSLRGGMAMDSWQNVSPVNGWAHEPGHPCQFRKTPWNTVQMRGRLNNGSPTVALFFLPTSYTPAREPGLLVRARGSWASAYVESGGSSTPGAFRLVNSGADTATVFFDGVEFSLDG